MVRRRLNDKKYIKMPEVWEAIRGGTGKLWRACLGRNPGARKGDGLAGYEEGVKIKELSPILMPRLKDLYLD